MKSYPHPQLRKESMTV